MSENKKISELDLVTSNASGDMFPLVQAGVTMRTTMSKIYDYLTSALSSTYYTKTQTDTLLNAKANQSTTYTKTEVNNLLADKQDNYDLENSQEGGDSCIFDSVASGLAIFTDTMTAKSNKYYYIECATIVANNYFVPQLRYEGAGFPMIMHYRVETGRIRLHFGNVAVDGGSGTATNAPFYVTFKQIN
jgi:hypothetical protein